MSVEQLKAEGDAAFRARDYDAALEKYSECIRREPTNKVYYSNRAAVYQSLGQYRSALKDAESALRQDSAYAKAWARKGAALTMLDRYAEAESAYGTALSHDAGNASYRKERDACRAKAQRPSALAFIASQRTKSLQFALRCFVIFNALLFFWPFFGRAASAAAYRRMLLGNAGNLVMNLKAEVGMPRFSTQYLAAFMQNICGQYLFLSMMLFAAGKPYTVAVPILLLSEVVHVFYFGSQLLSRASPSLLRGIQGQVDRVLPAILKNHRSLAEAVMHYSTLCEVMLGILLIVELLTPRRNFMMLIFYWQYLQMRTLLDQDGTGIKKAFRTVDQRILSYVHHPRCPGIIGRGYSFVRDAMARAATPPQPGQQGGAAMPSMPSMPSMPRCTIS